MVETITVVDGLERFGGAFRPDGVECDGCGYTENTNSSKYSTPTMVDGLTFDLFKRGWYSERGKHYCPTCTNV